MKPRGNQEKETHVGYSHPMGPQDQAKPAMKTQMHTKMPMDGGLGRLPWYFTNSYFRVTPTTISAVTIWMTPAMSRNLRPRRSTTTMATTVASTFTAGNQQDGDHTSNREENPASCLRHIKLQAGHIYALAAGKQLMTYQQPVSKLPPVG